MTSDLEAQSADTSCRYRPGRGDPCDSSGRGIGPSRRLRWVMNTSEVAAQLGNDNFANLEEVPDGSFARLHGMAHTLGWPSGGSRLMRVQLPAVGLAVLYASRLIRKTVVLCLALLMVLAISASASTEAAGSLDRTLGDDGKVLTVFQDQTLALLPSPSSPTGSWSRRAW